MEFLKILKLLEQKPLVRKHFDPKHFLNIWNEIKSNYNLKYIIRIVGTNGKGSSGRYLANFLKQHKSNCRTF